MLLLIILLIFVFGFGGGIVGYSHYGMAGGISPLGAVLLIILVLYLMGRV